MIMKPFFDVFTGVRLRQDAEALFQFVSVRSIRLSKDRMSLFIYIHSPNLIEKRHIHETERAIRDQMFPGKRVSVRILEKFSLSSQYTAQSLFRMYRESMAEDLKDYDIVLYNMLSSGRINWPEESVMSISIRKNRIYEKAAGEFERVLRRLFEDRCGIPFELKMSYEEGNSSGPNAGGIYFDANAGHSGYPEEQDYSEGFREDGPHGYDNASACQGSEWLESTLIEGDYTGYYQGTDYMDNASAGDCGDNASAGGRGENASAGDYGDNASAGDYGDNASAAAYTDGENAEGKQTWDREGKDRIILKMPRPDMPGAGAAQNSSEAGASAGTSIKEKGGKDAGGKYKSAKSATRTGKEKRKKYAFRHSESPDVLYGRDFSDDPIKISEVSEGGGAVALGGEILMVDERKTKTGKNILSFSFTDWTDSIQSKIFVDDENLEEARTFLKPGSQILCKGNIEYDTFDKELELSHLSGIKKYSIQKEKRNDLSAEKRVELHLHTKMSDMDGVSDVTDYIDMALSFGMEAMAITDHGVVQSFPDAASYLKKKGRDKDFKLIFGVEGYLVNDLSTIVQNEKGQGLFSDTVVFDIETTGFNMQEDRIIEIGAVKLKNNEIVDQMNIFVNPKIPIPFRITQLTSIDDSMVMDADPIEVALPKFLDWCGDSVIVAHNAEFDTGFVRANAARLGIPYDPTIVDTVGLSRLLLPKLNRFKLDTVAKELKIPLITHHRAVDDASCTAGIYIREAEMLRERGVSFLREVDGLCEDKASMVMKMPSYHVIILAKNDVGRINLYRLVSESHLKYFRKSPRIPKSLLKEYREGLIIGSACVMGELFQSMVRGAEDRQLLEIASFYDYLEIQPISNNSFMLASDKYPAEKEQDLIDYNLKILSLGDSLGIPVCATTDAHYVNPDDSIYRAILMSGHGFGDEESDACLYFRSTDEMLAEFSYLSPNRAREVVIENPKRIAAMCEPIKPVRPDKCPPVIPDSDAELRRICYETAHRMYGPELPPVVENRLETELRSIIQNGYSVMYIIAQKLVDKSNEDGYLVGSRGSVGSSFVATMAHITEVNPLSPHYVCPECFWYDFDSEEVKAFSGMAGCDMPPKKCPRCGAELNRWGFDIPFETFLGFKGDKEPDIDLNFSGEYQAKAHAYTGVLFGEGYTFKAGTIGTMADKTAYGYVKGYFEERSVEKRGAEIARLAQGLVGVRRTTGQHPGGIVVLPHGEDINTFTPIQHPANDMASPIITTHFDYHKIDHNLLKLDILGHDDPTMIRKLQDLTGVDMVKEVPFDCPEVMSLFQSTEALGIRPEDIQGVRLGCLGVPEFGTSFAMQMVEDTKPKYFSDLLRLSGLSHGTDVWLNNAQDLILSGTATLQEAICCRDDIMVYLIHMGLKPDESFKIMEATRKGKGLNAEWEADMLSHGVPQWYLDSCNKIKYMFPKAHAAAYVMMAWRVAYCKVFYPKEYYTAYFSIRADGFDYDKMCGGLDKLRYWIKEYRNIPKMTNTEAVCLRDMKITEEMYARGIEFAPIDIYKAKASDFQITEDGRIMPAFTCMAGLGSAVAQGIEEGAKAGRFLSRQEFLERTHCPKAFADKFAEMGLLGDIPESNQLSIFDMI